MTISIVIPAYNEEHYLGACLESVLAEVARAGVEAEVIVVNNASTDQTKEVAQKYAGVRVVDESRKGLVWARKAGWDATQSDLVANIDADVRMPTGWLTTVVRTFEQDTRLAALSGPYRYYDLSWRQNVLVALFYLPGYLFDAVAQPLTGRATMLQGGNFILKRAAWDKAGGFDTSIAFFGEDADIARRISARGRVRWTWSLPMHTSGRRLQKEGIITTGYRYAINLFWIHLTGTPHTTTYTDHR